MNDAPRKHPAWSWWYVLFLVPFAAVLWPPFFNSGPPYWHGIPYFYWYQMLWVLISAVLTALIYVVTKKP
jgi:Protein of unknown function (DUF3311)